MTLRAVALLALSWIVSAPIAAIYFVGLAGVRRSLRSLRRPAPRPAARGVAVVVPARNEAERLPTLLSALSRAGRGVSSVTVVDDGSTDGTLSVALEAARADPRVRAVRVEEPPPGWAPKAYAEHVGALGAEGSAYLFLDADVRGDVEALASIVSSEAGPGTLVAFEPLFRCSTARCRAAQPLLTAVLHGFFGFHRALDPRDGHSIMYGCCWGVDAYSFWEEGGMSLVRSELLEDRTLAVRLKERGFRLAAFDARGLVYVESWRGFGDLVNLMRRVSYRTTTGMSRLRFALSAAGVFLLFLWPLAAAPLYLAAGPLAALGPIADYALEAAFALAGQLAEGIRGPWFLLAPVAGAVIAYGVATSRGSRIEWRGRSFSPRGT